MTPRMNSAYLRSLFTDLYHAPPQCLARAPGRVNLIGEHTDYNAGFVLPIALDRAVSIAARARADRVVRVIARDFENAPSEFSLNALARGATRHWSAYLRGVAWALETRGIPLRGADLLIEGDVPIGAGLSSSAALEVAAALALLAVSAAKLDAVELARLCQKAENEFVGVQSGIMDQFASALARAGHALWIDCRDLSYEHIPLPRGVSIVVCDTLKRHGLVDSEYNARRAECEQAARFFGKRVLRDVSPAELARHAQALPPLVARRARHVLTENQRVLDAVRAARANAVAELGRLMNESHTSLRDDFQVSCAELDALVEIARKQKGCFGARLTGAGFGGCTVSLVEARRARAFVENVAREYAARFKIAPPTYVCQASAGAAVAGGDPPSGD